MQEIEAARDRHDLNISDLGAMSEKELRAVGPGPRARRAGSASAAKSCVDHILRRPDRAGRARLRHRHPRDRRRGLRVPAPSRRDAVPGRHVRRRRARSAASGCAPATSVGPVRAPREAEKYWGLLRVDAVNGVDPEIARRRPHFDALMPVLPDEMIDLETDPKNLTQRLINLIAPIGKGQRGLIVSPPRPARRSC